MSARNTLAAKAARREDRVAHAQKVAEKKVFFPFRHKNRNRYAFVDGAVVDVLADADLTPEKREEPRRVYGPKDPPS